MTVDPERLKVAMDAVQKLAIRYFNRSWLTSIEKSIVLEVITAINAHDRPSKVPGDEVDAVDAVDAALDGWFGPGWTSDATAGWLGPLRERMSRALAFAADARGRAEPPNITRDETLEEKLADATQRNLILRGAFDRMELKANAAVALLAEIAKTVSTIRGDNWSPWSMANGLSRICDLATRPLVEAPEPAYDAFVSTTVDSARTEVRGQCAPSQCAYFPEPCRSVSSCMNAGKCIRQAEADYVPASPPPPDTVPFTREMRDLINVLTSNVVYLLSANDASDDAVHVENMLRAAFPPNPKDNRDSP